MINDHRQVLYKTGTKTARMFEAGEKIPEGYTDLPNSDEWDNKPVQVLKKVEIEEDAPGDEKQKKFLSQMNLTELREQCDDLGIDNDGMKKKDMVAAIHALVDGGQDDTGKE